MSSTREFAGNEATRLCIAVPLCLGGGQAASAVPGLLRLSPNSSEREALGLCTTSAFTHHRYNVQYMAMFVMELASCHKCNIK